ncbi:DUF7504 family protein [Halorientalis halophila]|uniref:DUF7504 family protein n=1 Tax=Halorientalis halophila TaxID=3108499 RepID=UPI00300B6E8C
MTAISEQIGDATTVMFGAPSMSGGADGACVDLLTQRAPEETGVLWISFTKPASACLDRWRSVHGSEPGDFGVILVGETVGAGGGEVDSAAVQRISNASDLTGIGIAVDEFVAGHDEGIAVCFDSLTALLQYVDLETAYEFLHALTGKLYSAGAVTHFHIDPNAHDQQTIDTLLSLFDAEVRLEDEGATVRTRALMG